MEKSGKKKSPTDSLDEKKTEKKTQLSSKNTPTFWFSRTPTASSLFLFLLSFFAPFFTRSLSRHLRV